MATRGGKHLGRYMQTSGPGTSRRSRYCCSVIRGSKTRAKGPPSLFFALLYTVCSIRKSRGHQHEVVSVFGRAETTKSKEAGVFSGVCMERRKKERQREVQGKKKPCQRCFCFQRRKEGSIQGLAGWLVGWFCWSVVDLTCCGYMIWAMGLDGSLQGALEGRESRSVSVSRLFTPHIVGVLPK